MTTCPKSSVELHPIHAVLLASILPLYLGALLSDWAYSATYQVQWANFAAWLIIGALIFNGLALAWSAVDVVWDQSKHTWLYVGLLTVTFVFGAFNTLVHAKDAWASMPTGLILSIIVLALALAANWAGFSRRLSGGQA